MSTIVDGSRRYSTYLGSMRLFFKPIRSGGQPHPRPAPGDSLWKIFWKKVIAGQGSPHGKSFITRKPDWGLSEEGSGALKGGRRNGQRVVLVRFVHQTRSQSPQVGKIGMGKISGNIGYIWILDEGSPKNLTFKQFLAGDFIWYEIRNFTRARRKVPILWG